MTAGENAELQEVKGNIYPCMRVGFWPGDIVKSVESTVQ